MRDDDVRPLFDLVTSEQPPLGLDIARIAERGRRVRRRRTTLAAVGSSAAACAAIVLTVFALGARDRGQVEPATQLSTSPATTAPSTSSISPSVAPTSLGEGSICYLSSGEPCPQNGR